MKIERQFNKTSAALVTVQEPIILTGPHLALGVKMVFTSAAADTPVTQLAMHVAPVEAVKLGHRLIAAGSGDSSITADNITRNQRSILMYAETCAVDWGGLLEGIRLNAADHEALAELAEAGLVTHGRVPGKLLGTFRARQPTHWCDLTEAGWTLAHQLRRSRAAKPEPAREKVNAVLAERAEVAHG